MLESSKVFKTTILGTLIIIIFCIGPVASTNINDNPVYKIDSTKINNKVTTGILSEEKLESEGRNAQSNIPSQTPDKLSLFSLNSEISSFSRNLSIDGLVEYLEQVYEDLQFRDSPGPDLSYHTTVAAMQSLSILKMTGLEEYIIQDDFSTRDSVIKKFKYVTSQGLDCRGTSASEDKECGYANENSVNLPTLSGTFGAILSIKLIGNPGDELGTNKKAITNWLLNETLISNSTHVYFQDPSIDSNTTSIVNTYWGISALELLDFNFTTSFTQKVTATLLDNWRTRNEVSSFFDRDDGVSSLVKNYYGLSILLSLNRTNPAGFNETFWNEITSELPNWIANFETSSGIFRGGFQSPERNTPNIEDTGASLAILNIIGNSWSKINLTNSVNFILNNQFENTNSPSHGGWGSNNNTYDSSNPKVNTRNTFYAVLGLYASNYLSNITEVIIETSFGRSQQDPDLINHIVSGESSTVFFLKVKLSDKYTYSNLELKDVTFSNWTITPPKGDIQNGDDFEYKYLLQDSDTNNWTWGKHLVSGSYKLKNFNLLPEKSIHFISEVVVQPFYNVTLLNINNTVKPGTNFTAQIILDNTTLNPNERNIQSFGNFTIELYYPNGSSTPVKYNSSIEINNNTLNYWFNDTIPDNAPLGIYYYNVSILNGTKFATVKYEITVNDEITLKSINGKIDDKDIIVTFPGEEINFTLDLSYSNNNMSSLTEAYVYFINNVTQQKLFSSELIYQNETLFRTNTSRLVPNQLIMGFYNISIDFVWKSKIGDFNSTIRNSTLPVIEISGNPTLSSDLFLPGKVVQLGDDINFTSKLVVNTTSSIISIEESFELVGKIYYQTGEELIQKLSYEYLGNGYGRLFGKIIPNLRITSGNESDYYLKVEVLMNSTLEVVSVKNEKGNDYQFDFSLQADLKLTGVTFIQGNSTTNKAVTPVLIVNFNVTNILSNKLVGLLDLNGTFQLKGDNITKALENPIVPIEGNGLSSYQIQIPTENLEIGVYNISIFTVKAVEGRTFLGMFEIEIIHEVPPTPTDFPIEITVIFILLVIALIVTFLRGKIINKN
ncbi:MAG: hypothetical protein HeimC3_26950 [Candidatus Heimdallarchaeota archaeon LC_3]|nr:MAG: hypothetical protein HeimC3_26950 [Candidatus Heimdallarchaeota archaeon LC_3]